MKRIRLVLTAALVVLVAPATAHAVVNFRTTINCAQADSCNCPPGTGGGSGTLTLNTNTGMVSFNFSTAGTSAPELVSHVHGPAAPGVPAGVLFGLPLGSPKIGSYGPLDAAAQTDMRNNLHYFNLHTLTCTGGEIRGQIVQRRQIPVLSTWGIVAMFVLLVGAAVVAVRRQRAVA